MVTCCGKGCKSFVWCAMNKFSIALFVLLLSVGQNLEADGYTRGNGRTLTGQELGEVLVAAEREAKSPSRLIIHHNPYFVYSRKIAVGAYSFFALCPIVRDTGKEYIIDPLNLIIVRGQSQRSIVTDAGIAESIGFGAKSGTTVRQEDLVRQIAEQVPQFGVRDRLNQADVKFNLRKISDEFAQAFVKLDEKNPIEEIAYFPHDAPEFADIATTTVWLRDRESLSRKLTTLDSSKQLSAVSLQAELAIRAIVDKYQAP